MHASAVSLERVRRARFVVAFIGLPLFCGFVTGIRVLATLTQAGPPVYAYRANYSGVVAPGVQTQPSAWNAQANVFGSTVPPAADLTGSTSTFGGSPGTATDVTTVANEITGSALLACTTFMYNNTGAYCAAAAGSTASNVNELVAVQSWPFYVGSGTSSNVNPGAFSLETSSDDGSWLVLAPAAFTYTQPANFQGATGLTAGNAVVNNGKVQSYTSVTGTANIAAGNCAANVYWLTWEYYEAEGGEADFEYSWKPPGAAALGQATQGVVWGQVDRNGTPTAGDTVSVSIPGSGTQTVTTDANGCYGYNYTPFSGAQTITVTATDNTQSATQTTSLTMGNVDQVNFNFAPKLLLYKRITQVVTLGPTPGPTTTATTIVPTPDPSNPTGVTGTSSFVPGVYPGDIITYTIFFANAGILKASGSTTALGPTFADNIPTNTTLVAGSPTFTCCANPNSTIGATITTTAAAVNWAMQSPLPVSSTGGIQGNFVMSVKVK
jgi:uncharacterized repeat protein (TIGR01451 family)